MSFLFPSKVGLPPPPPPSLSSAAMQLTQQEQGRAAAAATGKGKLGNTIKTSAQGAGAPTTAGASLLGA